MDVANFQTRKLLADNRSSIGIILMEVLRKMDLDRVALKPVSTLLRGFGGSEVVPLGTIDLPTSLGEDWSKKTMMPKYLVADEPFAYNMILGRTSLNKFRVVVSTFHQKLKFATRGGIGVVRGDQIDVN
ncbi:UNVERIFIED_CONTAM: hypothetical protein Scaly_2016800 [Sesamum calycinum]|uniref:Uncharacterized protein n=1 Tax=Sesamum calycinum TaxID=2727403 RepID=A0AAW2N1K8_9LAMI